MDILQTLQTNEDIESFPCTDCGMRVYSKYYVNDAYQMKSEAVCSYCGSTYTS